MKHTWQTKFKVKIDKDKLAANKGLDENNIICLSKNSDDYTKDFSRWVVMLQLSNLI